MRDKDYYIALNMIDGMGSLMISRLLTKFGSVSLIFEAEIRELAAVKGVNFNIAGSIRSILFSEAFEKELKQIARDRISVITSEDEAYPERLRQIYDPPAVLYVKGDIDVLKQRSLAVIGCRQASSLGLSQAKKLAFDLAAGGFCIISGMAKGIDTQAHRGALDAGGKTVAVLGSGFNNVYPPENKKLFEQIAENGALVSEFSLNSAPLKSHFPKRNRIISGLAQAVIVVEAAKKSGSLITADLALSQGREVFAMPGAANSFNSQGTNQLIKDGARLVENSRDVLDGLEVIWDLNR